MKQLLAISMLLSSLFVSSCRSTEAPAPVPVIEYGTASCDFDGVRWYGVVEPMPSTASINNYLQIFKTSTSQYIHFHNFVLELGKFPVKDSLFHLIDPLLVNANYNASTGDVIEYFYEPMKMDTIENYLEFTFIDEQLVQGNFQCVFKKMAVSQIDSIGAVPIDTIFILNGKFSTPRTE
jgi:hypothetical protein